MGQLLTALLTAGMIGVLGGDVGGNGGDGIRCTDPLTGEMTFEVYDYFEGAHQVPSLKYELGPQHYTEMEKVEYALNRFMRVDPVRAGAFLEKARTFFSQVTKISDGPPLEDIPDTGDIKIPEHCRIEQIAIRRPTFHPSVRPFLVDWRLWTELDYDHRAGLILHEVVYGETIALGHRNSIKARKFNAYLSSPSFASISQETYDRLAQEIFTVQKNLAFKQDKVFVETRIGDLVEIPLRKLLVYSDVGTVEWHMFPEMPTWLRWNPGLEILYGVPKAADFGKVSFNLAVTDGEEGAISRIIIEVVD